MSPEFWRHKRVLLTGHTGFKGTWLSLWLEQLGAEVTGYSLAPNTEPAMYSLLEPWPDLHSIVADVRHPESLAAAVAACQPDIVIHMAAQALVRASYQDPTGTFDTNVIGTANLLDALRSVANLRAVLVITSDKVYDNHGAGRPFVESDPLGGTDPYSASKAAQELVTAAYANSYFDPESTRVATARAGNVIGGGDWAAERLIPDYFRSVGAGTEFQLRYPNATRPWQHVLEPLSGYLAYVQRLHSDGDTPRALNFGPSERSLAVSEVVAKLAKVSGHKEQWSRQTDELWPEHDALRLDSGAATATLEWRPRLDVDTALDWTAKWHQAHEAGKDMRNFSIGQIEAYSGLVA